jgi:NAD(P)-dependent dehydrogenase (short-subunit alcohol dehydrogenase family)
LHHHRRWWGHGPRSRLNLRARGRFGRCGLYVEEAEATVAAVRADGGTMVSMQPCDLTKPPECQALVDFAVHTFGRIDVHFNMQRWMAYFNWLEDILDEEWDRNRRSELT